MLLELFPVVILNNVIAFVNAYIHCLNGPVNWIFSDFLCFDISLFLLTVAVRGYLISISYCLFFSFMH